MCVEDDGENIEQLRHGQADLWVCKIILLIPRDREHMPLGTEVAHLAVAVYSQLVTRHTSIIDETKHRKVLDIVSHYAFNVRKVSTHPSSSQPPR